MSAFGLLTIPGAANVDFAACEIDVAFLKRKELALAHAGPQRGGE